MIDNKSPYFQKPVRLSSPVAQRVSELISPAATEFAPELPKSEEFFDTSITHEVPEQLVEPVAEQIVEQSDVVSVEQPDNVSGSDSEEIVQNSETSTQPTTHFFKCRKPDGTEVVYKKSTAAKTYATDLPAYRKYLAGQGIEILEEYFE